MSQSVMVLLAFIHAPVMAETPTYRPVVGETYQYGIECVVTNPNANSNMLQRMRCRVEFEVTAADSDGWTANYSTTPYSMNGPMIKSNFEAPEIPPPRTSSFSGSQMIAALRERSDMHRKELVGLMSHVDGTVQVRSNGECTEHTGTTRMPLVYGPVWAVPLMRLPEVEQTGTYSYKQAADLVLVRDGVQMATDAYYLNSFVPETATDSTLFRVKRSLEFAGGAGVDQELRASGNGIDEFSLTLSMPESGYVEIESKGLSHYGAVGSFLMRVSYQRLDDWQRELFDSMLVPTSEALDAKNLKRMTNVQMQELISMVTAKKPPRAMRLYMTMMDFAPPPINSKLYKTFETTIDRIVNSPAAQADMMTRQMGDEMRQVYNRWLTLYRLATRVPRQWSDASGKFRIQATLVDRSESDVRLKRLDSGQVISVPLDRLSDTDQEIIKTFAAVR